ncbi:MAG: DUF883 family protein [Pseudomonadota bacterium]|nr:DUF883 family protein [Pseudomonadota bacterium]
MGDEASRISDEAARLADEAGDTLEATKDSLMSEFRNLIAEGESLLRATSNLSGEALTNAREQFRTQLGTARERVNEYTAVARARGREAAIMADDYVHDNPWGAIGVAAGVGFVVGTLISRRS